MKKEKTGKTEKREPGRPSRYSAALAERICDHIRCGDSLRKAAEKEGVPNPSVMRWVHENKAFSEQYARAKLRAVAACEVEFAPYDGDQRREVIYGGPKHQDWSNPI